MTCTSPSDSATASTGRSFPSPCATPDSAPRALTGGFLRPQSLELVGALAESTFNSVNVGTAILGADGITAEAGVTTHDETEARTNHAMVSKAQRTVVVADGSKIGRAALAQCCTIQEIDMLITDDTADAEELHRIRAAGVEVVEVAIDHLKEQARGHPAQGE